MKEQITVPLDLLTRILDALDSFETIDGWGQNADDIQEMRKILDNPLKTNSLEARDRV